ncbi:MAG: helix-turn-helix transcriptional regulator [Ilumatobacteraceae bacterium]
MANELLEIARRRAGLTQEELADRASTSRPTLSAYESGRKSPTLATAERILHVAGFVLTLDSRPNFRQVKPGRGRSFYVADALWRLPVDTALARVDLPLHLDWSSVGRTHDLSKRRSRARCYEVVLREGLPDDIVTLVDGALLCDLWDDLVLPRAIRREWEPTIERR